MTATTPNRTGQHAPTVLVSQHAIEAALREAFASMDRLEVINESHLHAGHAGASEGSHWRVRISAPVMAGLNRVARHRLVYHALRPLIDAGIHALAIEAEAPAAR